MLHVKQQSMLWNTFFAQDDTDALILVGATNTFNQLNRQATLLNCDKIYLAMACIFINTYRSNSCLFVDG